MQRDLRARLDRYLGRKPKKPSSSVAAFSATPAGHTLHQRLLARSVTGSAVLADRGVDLRRRRRLAEFSADDDVCGRAVNDIMDAVREAMSDPAIPDENREAFQQIADICSALSITNDVTT